MDPQFCVDARLASSVALVDKSANLKTPTGELLQLLHLLHLLPLL